MMEGFFYAKIKTYEIQVYSDSPADLVSGGVIYIELDDPTYQRAELWFVKEGVDPIPENAVSTDASGEGTFHTYFCLAKMPLIVDTLRHEGPVWFWYESSKVAALRTGREPTGEVVRTPR
jgi:hypothetical protein